MTLNNILQSLPSNYLEDLIYSKSDESKTNKCVYYAAARTMKYSHSYPLVSYFMYCICSGPPITLVDQLLVNRWRAGTLCQVDNCRKLKGHDFSVFKSKLWMHWCLDPYWVENVNIAGRPVSFFCQYPRYIHCVSDIIKLQ